MLLLMGSVVLTSVPGSKHQKSESLSCSLSEGNSKGKQAGKRKNILNSPVLSLFELDGCC